LSKTLVRLRSVTANISNQSQQIQTKPGPFARINPLIPEFPCKSFTDSKLTLMVAKETRSK